MKGFRRPPVVTLPETSLVPAANQVEPPATMTHRVAGAEPYWFERPDGSPSGHFASDTEVAVVSEEGSHAWVADERGLMVAVQRSSLREKA